LDKATDERTHTRALAYLLDKNSHGYGTSLLQAVLRSMGDSVASNVAALVKSKRDLIVKVDPEFGYCDLWMEVFAERKAALVIVENKIFALEREGQLLSYERKADRWRERHKGGVVLLVYLSRKGPPSSDKWITFSYLKLATALRKCWLENKGNKDAVGQAFLHLYISTITRGVLGFEPKQLHKVPLTDVATYLGED